MQLPHMSGLFLRGLASAALAFSCLWGAPALAEQAPALQGTQLIMLGTGGGPILRKDRSEPATLLIVNGTSYLIDCGSGTVRRMLEAGIEPASVKTIFITHNHPDHNLDLASLIGNDYFSASWGDISEGPFEIYGPPGTTQMVDAAIRYISVPFTLFAQGGLAASPQTDMNAKRLFVAHEISEAGIVYQDDNIRVTSVENSHFDLMASNYREQQKSYSYRIETPHGVIVFTGDSGPSEALAEFAQGADVLVSEVIDDNAMVKVLEDAGAALNWSPDLLEMGIEHMRREHLTPDVIGRMAASAQVRAVVLNHFVPGMDNDQDQVASNIAGVQAGFDGQVLASRDLDHFCVNAKEQAVSPCP